MQQLYDAWIAADKAWMHEIEKAYPEAWKWQSSNIRYTTKGRGTAGTPLRDAYDAFTAAREAFHTAGGSAWLGGGRAADTEIQDRLRDEIANTGDC